MRQRLTLLLLTAAAGLAGQSRGPDQGSLLVIGGGPMGPEILGRLGALAGCPGAVIVAIPTAAEGDTYGDGWDSVATLRRTGCRVTVLHTRDRAVADTEAFVAPLRSARAVFFGGGRQWRLVDSYSGTLTQRAIEAVLARGGVVAGTSAGASIQASFLVRGAREGNTIMMAPEYLSGFGYLANVAVDQHLLQRKREKDLLGVIDRHPELLGIGIDEGTAIEVHGNQFEVIGCSMVAIYDHRYRAAPGAPRYYFLTPGDRYDLARRARLN